MVRIPAGMTGRHLSALFSLPLEGREQGFGEDPGDRNLELEQLGLAVTAIGRDISHTWISDAGRAIRGRAEPLLPPPAGRYGKDYDEVLQRLKKDDEVG